MKSARRCVRILSGAVTIAGLAYLVSAAPVAAGPKDAPAGKRGRTVISDAPWDPAALEGGAKVVYGDDDRIDVYEETDTERLAWAAATCALVEDYQLSENADGTYTLHTSAYEIEGLPPCEGEPFAGQPSAAFCTGFAAGWDLIATAGHCVDETSLEYTRFVFGFQMEDATTPVTQFDASQVYVGIEVVGHRFDGFYDYSIIRVDRPITAPGVRPLALRRVGRIPVGVNVGIIGHPVGLPLKIAFGDESVVRDNSAEGFFLTNLDTFGGNSGSPVFNAVTGLVEGILVFGEEDFDFGANCFRSNVFGADEGAGEGVSKSTTFLEYVPSLSLGQVALGKAAYQCSDILDVFLADIDLEGEGSAEVTLMTGDADVETLVLEETEAAGTFYGELAVTMGDPTPGNGVIDVEEGQAIIVVYNDADNGVGAAAVASTAAVVDCTPPVISGVATSYVGGIKAKISFETNEPCVGAVRVGRECDALTIEAEGPLTTAHVVTVAGLMPQTDYYFVIEAADAAKNTAVDDNGGACHAFTTTDYVDYFTEPFLEMVSDLPNRSVTFIPNNSASSYRACAATTTDFYTNPAGGRRLALADDDFRRFALSAGRTVKLYGKTYDTLYIGSNGYITFGGGDTACNPELASHFSRPRVSGYFGDLYPPFSGLSAFISVRQLPDRVAVTYKDMPDFWGDVQSFQIELFYDGVIRITWLTLTRPYGIIGLSAGHGVPVDFESSDLSAYTSCSSVYGNQIGTACAGAMVKGRGVLPRDGRDLGDLVVMGLAVVAMTARKPRRGRASAYVTPRTDEECCGTP